MEWRSKSVTQWIADELRERRGRREGRAVNRPPWDN